MGTKTTRAFGSAAAALALVISITACSSSEEGRGTEGDTAASDAKLAFGVQAGPNSLDPAQLHDGQQRYVWGSIYDTLIRSENDGSLYPNAAESWEYSDDALTLTLSLRDDMTFSDGDPVTAEAVKANLERTRDTAGPQQNNLSAIESVEATDEHTAVVKLSRPDPNLLVALSYGAGAIGDPDSLGEESAALDPVGSGPYVLNRDRTVDGSTYVLERRDDYWNVEEFPFSEITVRIISDRTALFNTLLAGEIDAATVDPTQAKQAESAGLSLTSVEEISVGSLILADRAGEVAPPLADVRVRQAISLALDRQGIVDKILMGGGSVASQPYNSSSPAFVEDLEGLYDFDVEKARDLLADAGYADGFTLAMPANLPAQPFQPTITQALADIGITAQWDPVPSSSSGQGTTWGAYFNFGSVAAPSRISSLYYQPAGSQNPFRYEDPEVTKLLNEVAAETDPDAANEIYQELNAHTMEQAWFAPVFMGTSTWATSDEVDYVGTTNSLPDIRVFGVPED